MLVANCGWRTFVSEFPEEVARMLKEFEDEDRNYRNLPSFIYLAWRV